MQSPIRLTPSLPQPEAGLNDSDEIDLLTVSWNQDCQCFAAGTSIGFRIYECASFKETIRREFLKTGGFGIVEMMFRGNFFALVGGGANPLFPPNRVMIWDDRNSRCFGELTFRSDVRAVKLREGNIVVVLERNVYVYIFQGLKLIRRIDTLANPRGLCCLSHHSNASVLACPGLHRGQVRVEHFGLKVTRFITAHDSHVACLALAMDGMLLATASTKGTLIRIFNTMDGTLLQEVRRGVDRADIYSIALSANVQWLVVSSDKGTVHVFGLKVRVAGKDATNQHASSQAQGHSSTSLDQAIISPNAGANPSSSLSFMKGVLPKYFSSEWSFAQFRLSEDTRYIVAFGAENAVIIVGMDGSFYRCKFDHVNGGEMLQQEYVRFLKADRS